jgi:hypothetical protein
MKDDVIRGFIYTPKGTELFYGTKMWVVTNAIIREFMLIVDRADEGGIEAQMKFLHSFGGVTGRDQIRNEEIRH